MKYADAWEELKLSLKYARTTPDATIPVARVLKWMDELEEEHE